MAKKRGELFTGVLGPFVYRIVKGKQIITARIRKGTMKQTQNTKDFSNTFGMAAKFAAALRKTIVIQLNGFFDDGMRNRLNGLATKILVKLKALQSFKTILFKLIAPALPVPCPIQDLGCQTI